MTLREDKYLRSIEMPEAQKVIALLRDLASSSLVEDVGLATAEAAKRLEAELDYYRNLKREGRSLSDIFKRLCLSLANRGAMFTVVLGGKRHLDDTLSKFEDILEGFDPKRILSEFEGSEARLVERLVAARGLSEAASARQVKEKRSFFKTFVRGVLSGACYFFRFKNGAEFYEFLDKWLVDPDMAAMLPVYFHEQQIVGLGPALAADFLKEIGIQELGKPDLWVKRIMHEAGWTPKEPTAFEVQKVFWKVWRLLGPEYPPVILDKLMYIVGSGQFQMVLPEYSCRSRFEAFAKRVQPSAMRSA